MSQQFDRVQTPPNSLKARRGSVSVSSWSQVVELERSRQYSLARKYLRECLKSNELDVADVHFHLGWCLEADESDVSGAFAHYMKAATLATNRPLGVNARYRAGLLALGDGNLEQAISLFETAREGSASSPTLRDLACHTAYWLGVCCEASDRILDAIELYGEVIQSGEPQLKAEARYRQLRALVAVGAFSSALQVADELLDSAEGGNERIAQLVQLAAEEKRQLLIALRDA